jgi:hypothetical protein
MMLDVIDLIVARFGAAIAADADAATVREVADEIYAQIHCRLASGSHARSARGGDRIDPRDFLRLLARANHGTGAWQSGWVVRALRDDGGVIAESEGVRFWIASDQFRAARTPVQPGDRVQVRVPSDYRQLVPGFYMATGDADDSDDSPIVRIYWNISARGALPLMGHITQELNRARLPFRFKAPLDPRDYGRSDAAVLYLPIAHFASAMPILARITAAVRPLMGAETSLFSRRCEPGVALAEDPGDGSSFGQHRARLIADALREPAAQAVPLEDRAVRARLRGSGYDPSALECNPGSTARYDWTPVGDTTHA